MKLELFKNKELGSVRVVTDDKGEPWFVLTDVCKILGLSNATKVANSVDDPDLTTIQVGVVTGKKADGSDAIQKVKVNAINESGLYQVVFQSRKPQAKQFKRWVTSEVLPSIRKHGAYMTPEKIDEILSDPDTIIRLATQLKREREARKQAENKVAILTHVNKLYTTTEIAKELGFKSAIAFNKQLEKDGIQYKINGTWVLYSKFSNMGLVSIKQDILDSGKIIYDRKWTGIGREFLIEKYANKY